MPTEDEKAAEWEEEALTLSGASNHLEGEADASPATASSPQASSGGEETATAVQSKHPPSANAQAPDDDSISIDFSKVKGWFKRSKQHAGQAQSHKESSQLIHEHTKSDDEISINPAAIWQFVVKHKTVLLILIPLLLSIYIRSITASLPVTDNWAENVVYNGIRGQLGNQVSQQYPNLPDAKRNELVDREFAKYVKDNQQQYWNTVKLYSDQFKSFYQYDSNGKPAFYLPDIDPYFYTRYAELVLKNGYPGTKLVDGKAFDEAMYAPDGRVVKPQLHMYFLALLNNVMNWFGTYDILQSSAWYPVIISALSIIPAFYIGRRLAGNAGGFFTAMMLAVNAAFINRTLWGHGDTDAYNVFFPLYITWFFLFAFEARTFKSRALWSALAGIFTGLFAFSWDGWWYVFDFLLAALAGYVLYYVIAHRHNFREVWAVAVKPSIETGAIMLAVSGIVITYIFNFRVFMNFLLAPFKFTNIKAATAGAYAWPNVLTTVAELNPADLGQVIGAVGGVLLFALAALGVALVLVVKRQGGVTELLPGWKRLALCAAMFIVAAYSIQLGNAAFFISVAVILSWLALQIPTHERQNIDVKMAILLAVWFGATIYASTKGIRFILLLTPAFSLAFGTATGVLYSVLVKWAKQGLHVPKAVAAPVLLVVFGLLLLGPAKASLNTARGDVPILNDAWYNSLTAIRDDSKPDAIITSWWDFGHHFKAISERRVSFDGASQSSQKAHWTGKILVSPDEQLSVGVLRLMDCGGDKAFNTLLPLVNNDTPRAIDILYKNMKRDWDGAKKELSAEGLTEEQAESVLQYTHCSPPEAYFIASEDMVGKGGVWGHFGTWNFKRADLWKQVRTMTKEEAVKYMTRYNYSAERAEQVYAEIKAIRNDGEANTWIAGWPGYFSGLDGCSRDGNTLDCNGRVFVNLTTGEVVVAVQGGPRHPRTLAFINSKGEYETAGWEDGTDVGVVLVPDNDQYRAALMAPEQAIGMFTRMFYFEGHGLKYFKPLSHQTGFTGNNIYVYKVDWKGGETTVVQKFMPRMAGNESTVDSDQLKVNESTGTEVNESTSPRINESKAPRANESTKAPVNESTSSPANQSTNQSTVNSSQSTVNQSTAANQSTNDSERLKEDIFNSI